ncbi:MocR-like pyridoxine biosynthesis transcription factor PdxR [Jiangella rhizosphaerae]|uniref:PLP-dependent aminotransferase family protein n=1 Tax=Jiangella rhizosphaerae TaxID=2293569 RepID=A0A418KGC6_9ACTN|nr:PLP-dependent aminotransferase family protein [Jiangella rhizosphaerae]RIQ11020.1 PLP-dependent aminotransferase family protein [Jiangella rhizosphaerae]
MAEPRTNSTGESLLVTLDRGCGEPLHRQLAAAVRDGVRSGRLRRGTTLPPTRRLAGELGVSRGVVVEAYQQLVAEGYLTSRTGGYTEVAAAPAAQSEPATPPAPPEPAVNFGYGRYDVANFPRAAWLRSIRRAYAQAPNERFGYLSGRGAPELHVALSDYLNRVRGTAAYPDTVVVTNGYAQGIALLVQVLAARGARRVAVEDPSADDDLRPLARASGLEVVGVPVDDDGIRADLLDDVEADALVLTPTHQWPTGAMLSAPRRAAVLRWAAERGALVVEDDYDAEYRYDRSPVGAMQGLAPELVAYSGTASKTLAPGLRLGWLVLPRSWVDDVAEAKLLADRGSGVLDQLAFADFLAHGEFDRHLRRMRPIYRRRRDVLLAALAARLPELEPAGISAGLHLVTWLPPGADEAAVVAAAARRGVRVNGVTPYRLSPAERGGLIFGYSALNERAVADGVARLAAAFVDLRRS